MANSLMYFDIYITTFQHNIDKGFVDFDLQYSSFLLVVGILTTADAQFLSIQVKTPDDCRLTLPFFVLV